MKTTGVLILLICNFALAICSLEYLTEISLNVNALEKLFDFIYERKEYLNFDGALGVKIATVFLIDAFKDPRLVTHLPNIYHDLHYSITRGQYLTNSSKSKNVGKMNQDYYILTQTLMNSNRWLKILEPPHLGNLRDTEVPDLKDLPISSYMLLNSRKSNTPSVLYSDKCLTELKTDNCRVSKVCEHQMTGSKAFGYALTHRLIHLLLAKYLQCDVNEYNYKKRTDQVCAEILMENDLLRRFHVPDITKDLFIEQLTLCGGILGYEEFFTPAIRMYPLLWQEGNGCFKEYPEYAIDHLEKRSSQNMDENGCRSHITGLAAAAIAGNIRYLVNKLLNFKGDH